MTSADEEETKPRGGARRGAGRPKGSGVYSEVRSVRLQPEEADHCRKMGGNRYLRDLIQADMAKEGAAKEKATKGAAQAGTDGEAGASEATAPSASEAPEPKRLGSEHFNLRVLGRVPLENDPKDNITRVEMKGSCGFPSPADDYTSEEFNLNDFFVRKPHATFVIEADGDSMIDAGISSGDILLVDSSKEPVDGDVVLAYLGGALTIKRFKRRDGVIELRPENKEGTYRILRPTEWDDFRVVGVVTALGRILGRGP